MQRYRWPGYEIQLLRELQRQQNNAQFCDTLLQTEGISVPTHSCILAALSPYLCQKLSASPSPPSGQKLQLQLEAVKAQTLLKVVGLLYTGVVEVKGSIEQNDLLSAAHQFGITDLVEGQKDRGVKDGEPQRASFGSCGEKEQQGGRERNESRKMQDAQVQAEMAGKRATDSSVEKRSCVSTGTQTVKAVEKTTANSVTHSRQSTSPAREPASSSVAQSLDFSITLQPQNITIDKHFYSMCSSAIPSVPGGAPSDGESTLDRSSNSVTNPMSTSALSSEVMSFPISLDNDSPIPQEDGSYQQASEFGDRNGMRLEDGKLNAKMTDERESAEQPSHVNRDEMLGEERGSSAEEEHAHAGMKSLAKTTEISIKVRLRRRTKGEVWEVVRMQEADETFSAPTSLKLDGSNHKRPQTDPTNVEPSAVWTGPVLEPETQIHQPATPNSPGPPEQPRPNTTSDSQPLCNDCLTPNQNENFESFPLPQPPGPVEESDEQIEKLLEDIMMGLNILPHLERDCEKSHHLHPSDDGAPATCQVPVTENERAQSQMHAAVSAAGCVYYREFGTQIGHSSTSRAQNQPSPSNLSPVQSDAVEIQQQQNSSQYHSSVLSTGQRDGMSHQSMPLSKSQNCPYPEAPTTRSVLPSAFYSSGQKVRHPVCQEPSSQDHQTNSSLLTNRNDSHSLHSLSCMDDLRLPRCLSPLEPFASGAKLQPLLNNSMNRGDKIQLQPSLHGRPWLAENMRSLQFPLSAITDRENKSVSPPQDTNHSCLSKRQQKHLELNPQNMVTRAESYTVKEVEEGGTISAGRQSAAVVKFDQRKMKESLKWCQGKTKSDAVVPKRRKRGSTSQPQDATGSLLAYKDVKVSGGTTSQNRVSVCLVSLSSNNVLAKNREMATSSLNVPNKFLGELDEPSTVTESWREKTRRAANLDTDLTRIRTRAILKKTQETPSNPSPENSSVVKPMDDAQCRDKIVNKEVLPSRRKRGRPPKTKPEESPIAIAEKKSHGVDTEQQLENNLPKEEEEGEKPKRRCKKRRRNRSEVGVIPLKRNISAKNTGKAVASDNRDIIPAERNLVTPKRPWMVTLNEFQMLIKRQHSKTRRSKENQDEKTNETEGDGQSEEMACGSTYEESVKETDMDITQSQSREGTERPHTIYNTTLDKNHNKIFNESTTENGKSQKDDKSEETSLFGDVYRPLFSFDVPGEEVTKLAAEREQPLKDPDEACDVGVSEKTQQTALNDKGSSHSDTHASSQEDNTPLDHNLNPQAPQRTGPPLSDAVRFIKSSVQDEEVEEEEVEVDVLLYSPEVPQASKYENGLENIDVTPEGEEEEDVNEIDVTGDEAE